MGLNWAVEDLWAVPLCESLAYGPIPPPSDRLAVLSSDHQVFPPQYCGELVYTGPVKAKPGPAGPSGLGGLRVPGQHTVRWVPLVGRPPYV